MKVESGNTSVNNLFPCIFHFQCILIMLFSPDHESVFPCKFSMLSQILDEIQTPLHLNSFISHEQQLQAYVETMIQTNKDTELGNYKQSKDIYKPPISARSNRQLFKIVLSFFILEQSFKVSTPKNKYILTSAQELGRKEIFTKKHYHPHKALNSMNHAFV